MIAAIVTQLDKKKKDLTGIEVVERVRDVLMTVVKSGELPAPPGETFTPVKTVASALPQVTEIPDGAPGRCFCLRPLLLQCKLILPHICVSY